MMKHIFFIFCLSLAFRLSHSTSRYMNSVDTSSDTEALKKVVVKTLLLPCIRREEASFVEVNAVAKCLEEYPLEASFPTAERFCRSGKMLIACVRSALSACDMKTQEIMESVVYGDFQDMCKQNYYEAPKAKRKRTDADVIYSPGQERDKRIGFERKVTRSLEKMDEKLDYLVALLSGNLAILKDIKDKAY